VSGFAESTQFGEGFVGDGPHAAHVNTVLGRKGGPVETAWVTALATPRAGHIAFVAVLRPNLAVKPLTLFVNKAPLEGDDHSRLTWGAGQAGVALGVAESVAAGAIPRSDADDLLLVAAVWINPEARDEEAIFANNRDATRAALEAGARGTPTVADMLDAVTSPANPYFRVS
jgi:5,6,7,8-tetrahydromethanopterin hydro-lyase